MHRQVFINKIVERVSVKYNDIKNQNINNTDANYYQWEFYSLLKFPKENKNKSDYPSINFRNKLSTYFNADNKKDAICFKSDSTIFVGIRFWYDDIHGVRSYYHYMTETWLLTEDDAFKFNCYQEIIADKNNNIINIIDNCKPKKKLTVKSIIEKANEWIRKNIFGN
jgi:hypothetical protein